MNKSFAILGLAAGLALSGTNSAQALPLNGTFAVTTWEGDNSNSPGLITDPSQQALPSAIAGLNNVVVTNFTYTGELDFFQAVTNTISAFIASGGGMTVGPVPGGVLSNSNFTDTTLFRFRFTLNSNISGIISHDDGVSLFVSDTIQNLVASGVNLLPAGSAIPTATGSTAYSVGPGTYDLFYSEVNGLPAELNFDVSSNVTVPEPVSMALLGAGLFGVGIARRHRVSRSVAA